MKRFKNFDKMSKDTILEEERAKLWKQYNKLEKEIKEYGLGDESLAAFRLDIISRQLAAIATMYEEMHK